MVKDGCGNVERGAELDNFHKVLMNISEGKATRRVRDFIVESYVRGAISCGGAVDNVGLEGGTAVFTKRRCLGPSRVRLLRLRVSTLCEEPLTKATVP